MRYLSKRKIFTGAASIICLVLSVYFLSSEGRFRFIASNEITIEELKEQLIERMDRVPEFVKIRQLAELHGVGEVYLFGGTASAWAHYVQWDLEREKGINNLQPERFDYDYTSIFRSNQDMDIVIDGSENAALAIENEMKNLFPFFQGKQSVWEVRLLNAARGDKDAILNNPDFLNQHSDSHSTGLIEVFGDGKKTVVDVKEVDSLSPKFLRDVHSKSLHYYYYPKLHRTTKRFLQGDNPEIFSVVRYLTKAFQYELSIGPESLAHIKKVIEEFDPSMLDKSREYISYWLEKNGPKLFQNAINIEYAWDTLEELGLRKKLIEFSKNISNIDSLAWWMNKEPLRSFPIGQGDGKTAKELGLNILAHETSSFSAYESITKSHTGAPNVLISRKGIAGEAAALGDGFYTKIGIKGARQTGITIRFTLDPEAKEGTDFIYDRFAKYVVVKNKNALAVIPESLSIEPLEYFHKLANEELIFDTSDKAVQEKVRRKISNKLDSASESELDKIYHFVKNTDSDHWQLYLEWFSMRASTRDPDFLKSVIKQGKHNKDIAQHILSLPHWSEHPEVVREIILKGDADWHVLVFVLSLEEWRSHPDLIELLIKKGGELDRWIVVKILSEPFWSDRVDWVETIIKRGTAVQEITKYFKNQQSWINSARVIKALFDASGFDSEFLEWIVKHVLSDPRWVNHPEVIKHIIDINNINVCPAIVKHVLSQAHWTSHPELIELLLEKGSYNWFIAEHVLSKSYWADHPEFVLKILENNSNDRAVDTFILSQDHWKSSPLLQKILQGEKLSASKLRQGLLNLSTNCNSELNHFIQ